jgi:hypothetical protein
MRSLDFFNLLNPFSRTMALGSTQPLTEPGIFLAGKGLRVRKADNLTAISEPTVLDDVAALTSHNSMGLHGWLQG